MALIQYLVIIGLIVAMPVGCVTARKPKITQCKHPIFGMQPCEAEEKDEAK